MSFKRKLLILSVTINLIFIQAISIYPPSLDDNTHDPFLVVALMVKNEER